MNWLRRLLDVGYLRHEFVVVMPDDLNKKEIDSWFVSSQPHELDYFLSVMLMQFPERTSDQVKQAVSECRKKIAPSEGREKLKACVRERLESQ